MVPCWIKSKSILTPKVDTPEEKANMSHNEMLLSSTNLCVRKNELP